MADLRFAFGLRCKDGFELLNDFRVCGSQILCFKRVPLVIVKFEVRGAGRRARFFPFDEAIAFGSDGAAEDCAVTPAVSRKYVKNRVLVFGRGFFEDRDETFTFEGLRIVRFRQCCEVAECRVDIHGFHKRAAARAWFCYAGRNDKQWDVGGFLVIGVLGPHAMIPEVPAMIAPEHNDGVG